MKIYTRSGDKGHTQIYADEMVRVEKHSDVLECYGTLDELNAHVGLLHSLAIGSPWRVRLLDIQQQLFQIGFAISAKSQLDQSMIDQLERDIDQMQEALPAQTHFILPGGCQSAAQAHVCRTVTRRAERRLVALMDKYPVVALPVSYVNRLSDWFYALARTLNHAEGIEDTKV